MTFNRILAHIQCGRWRVPVSCTASATRMRIKGAIRVYIKGIRWLLRLGVIDQVYIRVQG